MTKAVYRPAELEVLAKKVILESPTSFPELSHLAVVKEEEEEVREETEEYDGPTAEDLRIEADAFRERWEAERDSMIQSAKEEAQRIIKSAEEEAFRLVKKQADEAQVSKLKAQDEADGIIAGANTKAKQIETDTRAAFEKELQEAEEKGRETGREAGFAEGKAEVERLIHRCQTILERANDKRVDILSETEQEIVDLVLLISRKVIKVISENQKNIIVPNVIQALRKVKDRGAITIRVNLADLKLTTEHTKDFIKLVEGAKSIQIAEDSTIDQGGCIIETDFGEIDARISSQLKELESRILDISPIKPKSKIAAVSEG
ncbi:MAG: flagellar assembly protein FliH [Treponema sp.]|nr:flagellar assembly protein FliH [Treponema sp.]